MRLKIIIASVLLLTFLAIEGVQQNNLYASNSNWPAIFYVPHPDDEAIGMAAAIAEHKAAGRPVYIVLVTDGRNPDLLNIMNGTVECPLHEYGIWNKCSNDVDQYGRHHFNLTMNHLIQERRQEFIDSAASLVGRDHVFIDKGDPDTGIAIDDSLFYTTQDYASAVSQAKDIIAYYNNKFPGASHKFISGTRDRYFDSQSWVYNETHKGIYEAVVQFRNENPQVTDFRFYRVYVYADPAANQARDASDTVFQNPSDWQLAKQNALDCYKAYNPAGGKHALGYHSAYGLINNAYNHNFTYVDLLQ